MLTNEILNDIESVVRENPKRIAYEIEARKQQLERDDTDLHYELFVFAKEKSKNSPIITTNFIYDLTASYLIKHLAGF